jgi:hypothetical protein
MSTDTQVEQYALKTKKAPKSSIFQPSLFETSKQPHLDTLGPGRWITIHAEQEHEGSGHHVFVGDDGKMKTGQFAGKTMEEAFGGKEPDRNVGGKESADELRAQKQASDDRNYRKHLSLLQDEALERTRDMLSSAPQSEETKRKLAAVSEEASKRAEAAKNAPKRSKGIASPLDGMNKPQPIPEKKKPENIPLRDRKSFAEDLAKQGKTQQEITDAMTARGVANVDARRLAGNAINAKQDSVKPHPKYDSDKDQLMADLENAEGMGGWDQARKIRGELNQRFPGWEDDLLGETPEDKPAIVTPTKPNEEAKPNDQMGLFGEVKNAPSPTPTLKGGDESKGNQQSLFDTKGHKDQMLMFDDGHTPKDRLLQPESPQEKASSAFDESIDQGKAPREAAAAAQKQVDADYEFARPSTVRNAGEDLKGSARHKVNAWKGLDEAEKDGTAAEMVTRDQLSKLEPSNLMVHADKNPLTSLAMHYALKAFPSKPGTGSRGDHKKDREQFLSAYRSIKQKAEELASTMDDSKAITAVTKLQEHVRGLIDSLRGVKGRDSISAATATDRYNTTANDLVSLHKALQSGWRANKTGVVGRLNEFATALQQKYGTRFEDMDSTDGKKDVLSQAAEHAKDVMEGHSLNKTFGKALKKTNRFDPSEVYVKVAKRSGGRDLSSVTSDPNKATKHMVESMGLRGVQWGNTVTDDERKHHAAKAVEALTDLADVTGLHPKDIALDGKLGLAIGARGKGNASAHYEPGTQVINLTRSSGVGALAHEWGHAFDHMLNGGGTVSKVKGSSRGDVSSRQVGNYMSNDLDTHEIRPKKQVDESRPWVGTTSNPENMTRNGWVVTERPMSEIRSAFVKLREDSKAYRDRLDTYLREAVKSGLMSADKANEYWGSDHEIFARSFERHVQHKLESNGRQNTYLSGLGGNHPLWPTKEEASAMSDAFDGIMAAYRKHKYGSSEKVKFSAKEAQDAFASIERFTSVLLKV